MSDETGGDSTDQAATEPDYDAQNRGSLVVPGNVLPWLEDASNQTGVPIELLAAVVYQHSHWNNLTPGLILQVANAIGDSFDQQGFSAKYPGDTQPSEDSWIRAAATWAYGDMSSAAAQAYAGQLRNVYRGTSLVREVKNGKATGQYVVDQGVGVTLGRDVVLPTGKFTTARFPGGVGGTTAYGPGGMGAAVGTKPIIPGLKDEDAIAVKNIADSLFIKYLARLPTNAEYLDLSKKRWTEQTLETHLRNQPMKDASGAIIPGATLGRAADVRGIANQYANAILGRDADESEINWLMTQNIPANVEHISAFYQQVHDHAVWHGDPTEWRDMQKKVQGLWETLGLTGKADVDTINAAVDQKLTADQITERLRAMPAPGYPKGVTVGEVERLRTVAAAAKSDLFPGEAVTDAELHHLQGMSPEEVLLYYRSIVPKDTKTGLPVGIEKDYRAMANSVLEKYGIVGYDVTAADLKYFALTKADPTMILEHFASNPEISGAHPGLAYGMNTEQFLRAQSGLQDAFSATFGGQSMAAPRAGASKQEREGSLLGHAIGAGISPDEFGSVLETFRVERGRAPTAGEFRERRARPTTPKQPSESVVEPRYEMSDVGPRSQTADRGRPRPAVSA